MSDSPHPIDGASSAAISPTAAERPAGHKQAIHKSAVHRHFHRLAWLAVAVTFGLVIFGAFVRLSNAGLSCPDWPTCYGRAAWPTVPSEVKLTSALEVRPLEVHKAWREQVHRHVAAILGVMVLGLALLAARRRKLGIAQILVASAFVAASIPLYMYGHWQWAFVAAGLGEAMLLFAALRWSNSDLARVATLTLMIIIFQALLGKWTVTLLLKPVVVMAHLMGGLTTFALITWMAWRATDIPVRVAGAQRLRLLTIVGVVLLAVQIALGGWVSANYAALACGNDFPTCVGQWWPPADYSEGFVLWRGIGVDYEGGVLDGASRIAIQMAHRIAAVAVCAYLLWLALKMIRTTGLQTYGVVLALLTVAQVALGIGNVVLGLPLWVATLHTAGATLLVFTMVGLLARLRAPV